MQGEECVPPVTLFMGLHDARDKRVIERAYTNWRPPGSGAAVGGRTIRAHTLSLSHNYASVRCAAR